MFRLQDNTPSVYTNQSRDFQLFCRLYDCINNGVKYDIDSIINILDPMSVNDRILNLLCTRVGFFPRSHYDSNLLRHIIDSFPFAIKHKGTKIGIEIAVSTILKAEKDIYTLRNDFGITVQIDNSNHSIAIYATSAIENLHALDDFLSYILPVGYTYTFGKYDPRQTSNEVVVSNISKVMINPAVSNSQVRGSDRYSLQPGQDNPYQFRTDIENNLVGTFLATEVIGSNNYISDTIEVEVDNKTETITIYGNDISGTIRDKIDSSSHVSIEDTTEQ